MDYLKKIRKLLNKDLYYCFKNLGVTETARGVGVSPTVVAGWLDGLEVPDLYVEKLAQLADDVQTRLKITDSDEYLEPGLKKKSKWSKYEDNFLIRNWHKYEPEKIARTLKRGAPACIARMRHLTGSSSPIAASEGYTQASLARLTGYTHRKIRQAVESLGLNPRQPEEGANPGDLGWDNRQWRISQEDAAKIMNWVTEEDSRIFDKLNLWGVTSNKCISCGTTEEKHYSKDMCSNCYAKQRRRVRRGEPSILNGQLKAPHG